MNLSEPIIEPEVPDEGLLDPDQARRAYAATLARPLLTNAGIGSKMAPKVDDLILLANWIVEGADDSPLYPYADADGTVHLGPDVTLRPGGFLLAHGNLYEPSSQDDPESQGPENLTVIGGTDA